MRTLLMAAVGAASVLGAGAALAGEQDFTLVNRTGYQIDEVYVSSSNNRAWGPDIMGRGTLDDGSSVDITFNAPDNVCKWDMKVKYNDGDEAVWQALNLCNINKVSLYWDRKSQNSRAVTE